MASGTSAGDESTRGERLGGFVYGTILALAVVVAGQRAYPDKPGDVAGLVALECVVLWLAHVYAHGLGRSLTRLERLRPADLLRIAHHEFSIVEAAAPPVGALLLGAAGLVSAPASFWLAFGLGLVVLGLQGLRYARLERLGALATAAIVTANLALGLVLVVLKLLVSGH